MSDSEDEFASADEGEMQKAGKAESPKQEKASAPVPKAEPPVKQEETTQNKKGKQGKGGGGKKAAGKQSTGAVKGAGGGEGASKAGQSSATKDTKQKERPQSGGKNKQSKQKGGKGKGGQESKVVENTDEPKASVSETSVSDTKPDSEESVKDKTDALSESSKSVVTEEATKDTTEKPSEPVIEVTPAKEHKSPAKGDNSQETEESSKKDEATLAKSPSSQSITRPPPDHTDKQEEVLGKLADAAAGDKKSSGWGWGWGSSLLEVASTSVSTFTKEVGDGLHTMIETVESTLNVPDPAELAKKCTTQDDDQMPREEDEQKTPVDTSPKTKQPESKSEKLPEAQSMDKQEAESMKSEAKSDNQSTGAEGQSTSTADDQSSNSWFSSWGVSNISKMVENTSKTLVNSSLDALETLGKKTFDVINEHDPGLKKTRGLLHDRGDKPNLSAVLRDAKEQEEVRMEQEKESEEARKAHFGSLFDDYQGLAHLEALEMLSNQCEKRVNTLLSALPPDAIATIKPVLLQVKKNFEIDEEEDEVDSQEFELLVTECLKQLNVGTTPDKLVKCHEQIEASLQENCVTDDKRPDPKDLHRIAISGLAELTAKCIEQFHKAGELILMQKAELSDFVAVSESLLKLTKVLSAEVGILSAKYTTELNKLESGDEIKVNHLVTNVYLEASNSSSYVQDGFQLLLPVIQQAAIEKSQEPDT